MSLGFQPEPQGLASGDSGPGGSVLKRPPVAGSGPSFPYRDVWPALWPPLR